MYHFDIGHFLSGHVFGFLLVFCRVGSVLMLMPGIGETYVPARMRLMFALSVTFLMFEPLLPRLPAAPDDIAGLTRLVSVEIMVGLFFGTLLRLLLNVLETAGMVIGVQTGLSNATVLNPAQAAQSPLPSAFLSIAGLTLLFVTDMDQVLLRSLASLYDVFPAGQALPPGDMAQTVIHWVNESFVLGIELSMPFLVIGLLMYVALGLLQRLLPQVQLFTVLLPVQIWGGLTLLSVTIMAMMSYWLRYTDHAIGSLFGQ